MKYRIVLVFVYCGSIPSNDHWGWQLLTSGGKLLADGERLYTRKDSARRGMFRFLNRILDRPRLTEIKP